MCNLKWALWQIFFRIEQSLNINIFQNMFYEGSFCSISKKDQTTSTRNLVFEDRFTGSVHKATRKKDNTCISDNRCEKSYFWTVSLESLPSLRLRLKFSDFISTSLKSTHQLTNSSAVNAILQLSVCASSICMQIKSHKDLSFFFISLNISFM